MTQTQNQHAPPLIRRAGPLSSLILTAATALACSGNAPPSAGVTAEPSPSGPFKSLEIVDNDRSTFSEPRAGVPLPDGRVAFLASTAGEEDRVGLYIRSSEGTRLLYSGEKLVNARDIDSSLDHEALLAADPGILTLLEDGTPRQGAILKFRFEGGEPELLAPGYAPVSVTVGEAGVYFSGIDPESGESGVFRLRADTPEPVFVGAPLVDPSGIALLADGSVLVADTRLFESTPINSEAGILRIRDGVASLFASGFATGYPAGIALTTDESTLIVSGEGPDRSDTVYLFQVADPSAAPSIVTAEFSAVQNSSAGLKRARGSNTFVWASGAFNGGTVYKIQG